MTTPISSSTISNVNHLPSLSTAQYTVCKNRDLLNRIGAFSGIKVLEMRTIAKPWRNCCLQKEEPQVREWHKKMQEFQAIYDKSTKNLDSVQNALNCLEIFATVLIPISAFFGITGFITLEDTPNLSNRLAAEEMWYLPPAAFKNWVLVCCTIALSSLAFYALGNCLCNGCYTIADRNLQQIRPQLNGARSNYRNLKIKIIDNLECRR